MKYFHVFSLFLFLTSCASYEQFKHVTTELEIPYKIFPNEFSQTFHAVLQVMKKYDLTQRRPDTGVVKTAWIPNTLQMNFNDSFSGRNSVKAAKFKIIVNITKGVRRNREVSKVTIFKRQMVEQDVLQGWKVISSDGIQEKVILYRIARLLNIDSKLKKIEDMKSKEEEANF